MYTMKDREPNAEEELRDFDDTLRRFASNPPEERAYAVIKGFFTMHGKEPENGEEEGRSRKAMRRRFISWLIDPHNGDAKNRALERLFNEVLEEPGEAFETITAGRGRSFARIASRAGKPRQ